MIVEKCWHCGVKDLSSNLFFFRGKLLCNLCLERYKKQKSEYAKLQYARHKKKLIPLDPNINQGKSYKDYLKKDKEQSINKYGKWIRLDEFRLTKININNLRKHD